MPSCGAPPRQMHVHAGGACTASVRSAFVTSRCNISAQCPAFTVVGNMAVTTHFRCCPDCGSPGRLAGKDVFIGSMTKRKFLARLGWCPCHIAAPCPAFSMAIRFPSVRLRVIPGIPQHWLPYNTHGQGPCKVTLHQMSLHCFCCIYCLYKGHERATSE